MPTRMTKKNKKNKKTKRNLVKIVKRTQKFKGGMFSSGISRVGRMISGNPRNPVPSKSPENIQHGKEEALRLRQMKLDNDTLKFKEQEYALQESKQNLKAAQVEFAKLAIEEIAKNPLYQKEMFKESIDKLKENIDEIEKRIKDIKRFDRDDIENGKITQITYVDFSDLYQDAREIGHPLTKIKNSLNEIDKIMNPDNLSNGS